MKTHTLEVGLNCDLHNNVWFQKKKSNRYSPHGRFFEIPRGGSGEGGISKLLEEKHESKLNCNFLG